MAQAQAVPLRKDFDGWEKMLLGAAALLGSGFGLAKLWPALFSRAENRDNLNASQSREAFATLKGEMAALRQELADTRKEHRGEISALRTEHAAELAALELRVDANTRAAQAAQSEAFTLRTDLRLAQVEGEQKDREIARLLEEKTQYAGRVVELEAEVGKAHGVNAIIAAELARIREALQQAGRDREGGQG